MLLFAVSVKIAQYGSSSAGHPNPVASSKLWLNGQKMELQDSQAASSLPLILCFALTFFAPVVLAGRKRRMPIRVAAVPKQAMRYERHRFLRPPPAI